jgi:uncharacterized protein YbjQ (UPF0145 family)
MGSLGGLVQLGIFVALVLIGLVVGRRNELKHYKSIHRREALHAGLPAIPSRQWDTDREVDAAWMESASVVISIDYFKRFAMSIRNLFGGNIRSYESLLDRARREAVLRLKEAAVEGGADIIVNLRLDTSSISGAKTNSDRGSIGAVEMVASGTAIRYQQVPDRQ